MRFFPINKNYENFLCGIATFPWHIHGKKEVRIIWAFVMFVFSFFFFTLRRWPVIFRRKMCWINRLLFEVTFFVNVSGQKHRPIWKVLIFRWFFAAPLIFGPFNRLWPLIFRPLNHQLSIITSQSTNQRWLSAISPFTFKRPFCNDREECRRVRDFSSDSYRSLLF